MHRLHDGVRVDLSADQCVLLLLLRFVAFLLRLATKLQVADLIGEEIEVRHRLHARFELQEEVDKRAQREVRVQIEQLLRPDVPVPFPVRVHEGQRDGVLEVHERQAKHVGDLLE